MRSRFEAFRDADVEWLLASWHPSMRPAVIDLSDNPRWRGLQIVDVVDGTSDHATGVVEFRATYLAGPGDVRAVHERSRFVREDGRWYYLDGASVSVAASSSSSGSPPGADWPDAEDVKS
jgi:SEC-C motif-containing protein